MAWCFLTMINGFVDKISHTSQIFFILNQNTISCQKSVTSLSKNFTLFILVNTKTEPVVPFILSVRLSLLDCLYSLFLRKKKQSFGLPYPWLAMVLPGWVMPFLKKTNLQHSSIHCGAFAGILNSFLIFYWGKEALMLQGIELIVFV